MLWKFKLKRALKELEEKIEDKVEVYFHEDGDGIVSAAVFSKYLDSIGVDYELIPYYHKGNIRETRVQKVFLDVCPNLDGDFIVIDHHIPENRKYLLYINFRKIFGKAGSNAFYLSLMLKERIKIHPSFFVVASLQDGAFGEVKNLLKEVLKDDYEVYVPRDYPGMYLQVFSSAVNSILVNAELWREILNICRDLIDNGLTVIEKETFWKLYDEYRKGVEEAVRNIVGIKNYGKDLTIIKLKDRAKLYRFSIAYAMSTFEGEVKLFLKEGDRIKFSLRSYRVNLYEIMKEVGKKVEVSWGGHERAIGGWIKREDVERFIETLKEVLRWKR